MNIRKMRNTKGITLVALIVTIIVLLILAGISLNLIMGEKGITQRAVNAGKVHNISGAKEKLELQIADYAGEYYQAKYVNRSVGASDVGSYVLGKFSPEETTFEENYYLKKENSKLILTSSDRTTTATCTVDSNGKVVWEDISIVNGTQNQPIVVSLQPGETSTATETDNYIDTSGRKATVPKGYTVSNVDGEKLVSQGLVILKDSNEYVWIEVPRTGGPDYSAVTGTIVDSAEYYAAIEEALIAYAGFSKTGTDSKTTRKGWKDEWYLGCGISDLDTYTLQYQRMLKSVYTNGGFWIGRYEASNGTDTPLSLANQWGLYGSCSEAQIEVAKVATNDLTNPNSVNYTSSLMFGVQWDLVCKFLEGSSEWPSEHDASWYIRYDSHSWGNCSDYDECKTGSSTNYKRMNIYDFAGNYQEWTLEHATSDSDRPCAIRGGHAYGGPCASNRNDFTLGGYEGARVSIY